MNSRLVIPVLCVGAVAFACGPRAHNEASAPKKDSAIVAQSLSVNTAARRSNARADAKEKTPAIAANFYVRKRDAQIELALHVVNTTKKGVELTFPTGQTHDFVILDTLGRELWRWGRGRMFTQTLRNKQLGGGESLDLEETMKSQPLPPGRYVARAILTSENFPLVEQTEFTINATTIAAR
jgi:hypothetical protein